MKTFPIQLAAARIRAGLSIPELARKSEVSDDAIRLYEAGERDPKWSQVQKLATALKCSTEKLRDK